MPAIQKEISRQVGSFVILEHLTYLSVSLYELVALLVIDNLIAICTSCDADQVDGYAHNLPMTLWAIMEL